VSDEGCEVRTSGLSVPHWLVVEAVFRLF